PARAAAPATRCRCRPRSAPAAARRSSGCAPTPRVTRFVHGHHGLGSSRAMAGTRAGSAPSRAPMAELHEHARNGGETPSELSDLRSIDVRLAGCAPTQNRHTAPTRSSARVTWILTAIVMLVAPAAAADPRPRDRVAVVALDLGPSTPPYLRATATSQIQAALAAAGNEVMPTIEVRARLSGELAGCRKGECVRRVGEALGARSLVFVTIDGKDENLLVAMRLHDGRTGEPEAEVREVCDLC